MNKGELKAVVLDTLVRKDLTGNPVVDSWVEAATSRLNEDLLVKEMLTRVTRTVTQKNILFPPDFISVKTMRITSGDFGTAREALSYLPPEEVANITAYDCHDNQYPAYFTTFGKEFELVPYRAGTTFNLDLWYYGEILPMVSDTETNAILTKYPQLYVNLTCSIGHQYLLETENAMSREAMAMAEIQRIMTRKEAEKYGDGPLILRPTRRIGGRFS
jgi:hypothetical protein